MSDNEMINAGLSCNLDPLFWVMVTAVAVISLVAHLNRRRWVTAGKIRVCGQCRKKYVNAIKQGVSIGAIVRVPSQDDLKCDDCGR